MLQGPPGTGKTWLAKRLGFALVGSNDRETTRPGCVWSSFTLLSPMKTSCAVGALLEMADYLSWTAS